jgi:spermidine/putrescine-binding protein
MEKWPMRLWLTLLSLILAGLTGCDRGKPPESKPPQLANELVFYSWAEYMPQTVIDAFAKEFGVKVIYEMYDSTEAAAESLRAGKRFDVATIDNNYLAALARDGLIAALDDRNIPISRISPPAFAT